MWLDCLCRQWLPLVKTGFCKTIFIFYKVHIPTEKQKRRTLKKQYHGRDFFRKLTHKNTHKNFSPLSTAFGTLLNLSLIWFYLVSVPLILLSSLHYNFMLLSVPNMNGKDKFFNFHLIKSFFYSVGTCINFGNH